MSFIITRSDLLAPRKEQVDSMMPNIVHVLRDALGSRAESVRLGNVRCVSAKRGWWTNQVKEEIYDRGGGGWMVGKVNVGKSRLFEAVFPKGRTANISFDATRHAAREGLQYSQTSPAPSAAGATWDQRRPLNIREEGHGNLQNSNLPCAPPETPFPELPLVSSLPGTTASPIRLAFGNGKGELVDLPGLERGNLEAYVMDEFKPDLIMRNRPKPEQVSIKYGQSLLVGGLIRITPLIPDLVILAYPFIPLRCHITSTERAIAIHTQQEPSGVPSIMKIGAGNRMASAGRFPLKWDVTKQQAGPLTSKAAGGLKTTVLPFIVLSTDLLIEGCGWVELVAQVRKKDFENQAAAGGFFDDKPYPMVEVVSPGGRSIGVRRPLGAWLLCSHKPGSPKHTFRARRSMKGVKKRTKKLNRII